jgi:hypothetical protein
MVLNVEPRPEWNAKVAAFCGAIFGAVAAVVHQLYSVVFSKLSGADPFLHIAVEMAVLMPSSATLFAVIVIIRNWLLG